MTTLSLADGDRDAATPVPRPHLFLLLECARPLSGGARHALHDVAEVRIGRGDGRTARRTREGGSNRLTLALADKGVSTSHARIVRRGSGFVLEDLGSKNGCTVAGRRVTSAALADGDVIQIGRTLFLFRAGLPTPEGTSLDAEARGDGEALATLVPALARQLDDLVRVAASGVPVLLLGETGTGKEVLARALHALSGRRGPFVAVNCGAIPATMVESELFGHKKGAFSGALGDHPGLVRSAEGGTLLLDEMGDLPLAAQVALLRALQESEVRPLGSTRSVRVDVRYVAATHQNLARAVREGRFREDLYARLSGFRFGLWPLRARREDLGGLVASMLVRHGAPSGLELTAEAGALLASYTFPRNVRELEQALRRALVLAGPGPITAAHLPEEIRSPSAAREPAEAAAPSPVDRAALEALLRSHDGNVTNVAAALSTSRSHVHRLLKRFGLDPSGFRGGS